MRFLFVCPSSRSSRAGGIEPAVNVGGLAWLEPTRHNAARMHCCPISPRLIAWARVPCRRFQASLGDLAVLTALAANGGMWADTTSLVTNVGSQLLLAAVRPCRSSAAQWL